MKWGWWEEAEDEVGIRGEYGETMDGKSERSASEVEEEWERRGREKSKSDGKVKRQEEGKVSDVMEKWVTERKENEEE